MNYRELIKEDFFFVDHTRYLRELEKYKTPVFLRPKRFGNSLWVSMLEYYYDVRFKDQFRNFTNGLITVGRTYFTGVLPITLDDLSSGYNVGTIVNLRPNLLGMVGFSQTEVERYVGEIFDSLVRDPNWTCGYNWHTLQA